MIEYLFIIGRGASLIISYDIPLITLEIFTEWSRNASKDLSCPEKEEIFFKNFENDWLYELFFKDSESLDCLKKFNFKSTAILFNKQDPKEIKYKKISK